MPVGLIWGLNDVTFAYYHHKEVLKLIPDAMFASIEHAGHLPQYEQPESTLVALQRQIEAIHKAPTEGLRRRVSPRLQALAAINRNTDGKRVDNDALFDTEFFHAWPSEKREIVLGAGVTKEYLFPTFYSRVVTSVAMFTCDYRVVSALIEDQGLEPIRVGPQQALLTMTSYRYNEVRGMDPYNEVAISVLVRKRGSASGVITTVKSLMQLQGIEAYVLSMPVTTQENQIRGRTIWGLPKDVRSIRLRQVGTEFVTTVETDEGKMLYEFSVPMTGSKKQRHQKLRLRSVLHQRSLVSSTESKGEYVASSTFDGFVAPTGKRRLILGDAPESEWLQDLNISAVPFHTEFSRSVTSMLSAPEPVK